jgi:hypothetical protein
MTTIYMPSTPGLTHPRFGLVTNTQRFESPLTKNVQRVLLAGSRWQLDGTLPAMNRDQMGLWQAFFLQLEGSANTFWGFDPDGKNPRGPAGGTPLVNGGSQTGSSLIIDGATPSVNGWLLPGDYFSVNSELKMVTSAVNTDGSGNATINFKPALRSSPSDDAALTVRDAACTMILTDDMQAMWNGASNKVGFYEPMTFSAFEVFS